VGIHHITAIAGDPQRNLDFYAGTLGLRLVKLTVNFDDLATYHFYYGDELGRPGSLVTFFPWPAGPRGRQGTGQAATVALSIASGSLGFWIERFLTRGVRYRGPVRRFDEQVLSLTDPDGLLLELVASSRTPEVLTWQEGPVPVEHAIRGLHGATLWEDGDGGTVDFLRQTMEFTDAGEDDGLLRFQSERSGPGTVIYVRSTPGFWQGVGGVGTVHHVAFRASDQQAQLEKRAEIESQGRGITSVIDRQYFRSVYFPEPGGVLFEIATDGPGFTVDESPAELGTGLRLPPMYEENRPDIELALPPLRLPTTAAQPGR
jgi:catechol 2,3-dioxygenase-like lactoylglutathione lyase family enzyme